METNQNGKTRKITIVFDNTNEVCEFESKATTLGEMKAELSAKGVNTDKFEFHEATSLTIFTHNDTKLPEEVVSPVSGEKTPDLAFMMVSKNKNIDSGRSTSKVSIDRNKAFGLIKNAGMKDKFENETGKRMTNASSDVILEFINKYNLGDIETKKLDKSGNVKKEPKQAPQPKSEPEVEVADEPEIAEEQPEPVKPDTQSTDVSKVEKPSDTHQEAIKKADSLINRINSAILLVLGQVTKNDVVELIGNLSEADRMEIASKVMSEFAVKEKYEEKPKNAYNDDFFIKQFRKIKSGH